MSVEDLKKYGQLCAENEDVTNRAKEIGLQDIEGHTAHGKELGLEFGTDDFVALAEEVGITEDELTEEQLEMVAGGAVSTTAAAVFCLVGGLALIGVGAGLGAAAGAGVVGAGQRAPHT